MSASLTHRGPDDQGEYFAAGIGLGFRRLSILDLSPAGHQPMASPDGSVWVTFNGEIYNFQELRAELEQRGYQFRSRSDTEVILHGYDAFGPDILHRLVGMFAIALWDNRQQRLLLARDRFGKKPLFYAVERGDLYYASELQALRTVLPKPELDHEALAQYFRCQFIPHPRTIYQGVFQLPPGHWASWQNGRLDIQRYWQLPFIKHPISLEQAGATFEELFRTAVRQRMISDVPLGVFLSGGLDSAIITALMAETSSAPVKTFSIGFAEQSHNELPLARLVAERYGTEHHECVLRPDVQAILPRLMRHYGQPFADSSAVAVHAVAEATRPHATVALNGDGGDENFAGYDKYALLLALQRWDVLPARARKALWTIARPLLSVLPSTSQRKLLVGGQLFAGDLIERYLDTFFVFSRTDLGRLMVGAGASGAEAVAAGRLTDLPAEASLVDRVTALDLRMYLPDGLMSKADIATMANSLEARSPFLDHRVVEFTASLPDDYKIRDGQRKYLLRRQFAHLLPSQLLTAPKHGFDLPVDQWLKTSLRTDLEQRLRDRQFTALPFLNHAFIDQLLAEHFSGRRYHGIRLWSLLCFATWYQEVYA